MHCIFLSIVRPANKIGEYAELGDVTRDKVKEDELEFAKVFIMIIVTINIAMNIIETIINMPGSGEQSC